MPLLKKQVFQKASAREFLRDDEEVFYCKITNEIFREYEEFAERMLLCNSMVWTCSMTGKSNLTYEEALESEDNARKCIQEFSKELHVPVLYIASLTKRTSFGDMVEDVFLFAKDRYFIGETLETSFTSNKWKESQVLHVIAPSEEEIKKALKNGNTGEKHFQPPASLFKYEIEHLDAEDQDISEIMIVDFNQIRRKKFSREKCKLFLKQYVSQDDRGIFIIKSSAVKDFQLDTIKFDKIFSGPLPKFESSKRFDKIVNKPQKKQRQETLAKFLTKVNGQSKPNGTMTTNGKGNKSKINLLEQMEKRKEEFKQVKQQKEVEKLAIKQKQKELNMQISSYLRTWYKPKEDLELEDQQILPLLSPVKSRIPEKHFGDTIVVLEFIKNFEKFLKSTNFFPNGVTIDIMERALIETEVAGPLADLIQMFLTAIFDQQEKESLEYKTEIEKITDASKYVSDDPTLYQASKLATVAAKWSFRHQGMSIKHLPLYTLTVSEILRIHLLSSGARLIDSSERVRSLQRGWYTSEDDPALWLRQHKPHLLKALSVCNVTQLSLQDKLDILSCLVYQLLTYSEFRDNIEDRMEKNKKARNDLKAAQLIEKKREADFGSAKFQLKKEAKENPTATADALEELVRKEENKKIQNERKIELLMKQLYEKEIYLGTDRAFRQYLKLESLPGVLVNFEDEPGICLDEITEQVPELVNADRETILDRYRKSFDEINLSDKENKPNKSTKKLNGDRSTVAFVKSESTQWNELLMCSADSSCLVHFASEDRTKWSFVPDKELLDEIINKLNKRGIRESELQQTLQNDKEVLIKLISKTPVRQLNAESEIKTEDDQEPVASSRTKRGKKNYEEANFGFPQGTSIEEILRSILTDDILEMEEKMYTGSLGQLQVKNRDRWRNALLNKDYNSFEKKILKNVNLNEDKEESGKHLAVYKDPGQYVKVVWKKEADNEITDFEQTDDTKVAIECLSIALAQIAHAVEFKYLKKPLGDAADRNLPKYLLTKNRLENWEQSLLTSTSFSQVCLHYSTLDYCIMWSRSTLKARCKICRRQKDSENMLLCDSCNSGHHLYCLKPKLTSVPKGDWFCDRCRDIKEKEEAEFIGDEIIPKKKKRIFVEEEEEAEEQESAEEENEDEENSDDEQSDEQNSEPESETEIGDENDEEQENSDEVESEICATCGSEGTLISCEICSATFHKECVDPPLRRPKSNWKCSECRDQKEDDEEGGKSESNSRERSKRERERTLRAKKEKDQTGTSHGSGKTSPRNVASGATTVGVLINERRCAVKARHNIHNFAVSLRRPSSSSDPDDDSGTEEFLAPQRKRSFRRESGRDDLPLHNAPLQDLLRDIMRFKDAWPFLRPVQKNEVPDYYDVITHPMDFGTIKYKLNMGEYTEDAQLMQDVFLVFQNCDTYNEGESEIFCCGARLLEYFKKKCAELGLKLPGKELENNCEPIPNKRRR